MPRVQPDISLHLRPARESDQWTIRRIVWRALINPLELNWQRFLIAEIDGRCIGVGQVKPHAGGLRELASIAVIPAWQGKGIGSTIIRELLSREQGPVYLTCRERLESYYERFGFHRISIADMPTYFRTQYRLGQLFGRIPGMRKPLRILVMKREASGVKMEGMPRN